MKMNLTIALMLVLAVSFTAPAFAGKPKCPCFKAKDLEKLYQQGWVVSNTTQMEFNKRVQFDRPAQPWDRTIKGKGEIVTFQWTTGIGGYEICYVGRTKEKWKDENYNDKKSKSKTRSMLPDEPSSYECSGILDVFLDSLP